MVSLEHKRAVFFSPHIYNFVSLSIASLSFHWNRKGKYFATNSMKLFQIVLFIYMVVLQSSYCKITERISDLRPNVQVRVCPSKTLKITCFQRDKLSSFNNSSTFRETSPLTFLHRNGLWQLENAGEILGYRFISAPVWRDVSS